MGFIGKPVDWFSSDKSEYQPEEREFALEFSESDGMASNEAVYELIDQIVDPVAGDPWSAKDSGSTTVESLAGGNTNMNVTAPGIGKINEKALKRKRTVGDNQMRFQQFPSSDETG